MRTTTPLIALLTGAFDGIDPAVARCLAAANYHVILTGPDVDALLALAGKLAGSGPGTAVLAADPTDPTALASLVADGAHGMGKEMSASKGRKQRSGGFAVAAGSWMDRYTRAHGVESSLLMSGRGPNESRPLEWWERMAFSERR